MRSIARRLLPALASVTLASPALADPALWEVRDDDSAIWLFGSFHVLPQEAQWRSTLFETIFADADKVVFETDIRPAAAAQVGAEAYARGVYVDGTLLTDVLDDETEAQLRDFAASISMPVGPVLAMRPWLAASTISSGAIAAEGFTAQGVEFVLQPELAQERVEFLETGEEQLDVLAGAPEDEQVAMLVSTLAELENLPKIMDKMLSHWLDGTPDTLSDIFLAEMGGEDSAFAERLLYDRNQNWMAPIEAMLADNEENLIVVGAAHLIGDRSVLDLLEKAGYEVERIQ